MNFDTSDTPVLPYDDVPINDDSPLDPLNALQPGDIGRSLADRIGSTKVYLLSDASKSRSGKRRRDDTEEEDAPAEDVEMEVDEGDTSSRRNAILLQGVPISHLPTSNIFAYATHFEAYPVALEWIDDRTCVLVFETKADARGAFRVLQKSFAEEPSVDDGTIAAKPIPMTVWPNKDRIDATLGKSEGLKGILRMRWARVEDVKKKRAREESEFYKKYGRDAGKTFEEGPPPVKRRRSEDPADDAAEKAKLDDELDNFKAEDEDDAQPASKMRSDYIGKDGRTLLNRTSQRDTLSSRITAPLPRRARPRRGDSDRPWDEGNRLELHERLAEPVSRRARRSSRERPRERKPPRPRATREDLDAELDAFLNAKD